MLKPIWISLSFLGVSVISQAQSPTFTEYPIPTANSSAVSITTGPDAALWFTEATGKIGRITTSGAVTEYAVPTPSASPFGIIAGPDGALWFTELNADKIGRISTAGAITEYPVPSSNAYPLNITAGPDGNLWFTEGYTNQIGRSTTSGVITEYPLPIANTYPDGITVGSDGALWFTGYSGQGVYGLGRITTSGTITEYQVPPAPVNVLSIVSGPDGNLWFTQFFGNDIGSATTAGVITEYPVPTMTANPAYIAAGPDGALWFTEYTTGDIGRISTSGVFTEYAIPTSNAAPEGITSGPDGALWFVEHQTNQIGRIAPVPPAPLVFVPVAPCRVVDTRNATGPFGGPGLNGDSRSFDIPAGSCNIPSTALAYSFNVTVVPSGSLGYLTIWPTGLPQPIVSTLNSKNGIIKADAAIVPAGTNGSVSVYGSAATNVVLDINGYFVSGDPSGLAFYPVTPCRLVDTRNAPGPLGGPIMTAGQTRTFPLPDACSIPASVQAYSLNFTVVPSGVALGYLTTWPTGESQPVVSTLNAPTGLTTANAAIVPAGTSGAINIFTSNTTQVVIDINGYFAPPATGGLSFYTVYPCRVVDTRNANGPLGGPELVGESARSFPLSASACGLPTTAQGYSLNATVLPPAALGYLTLWPAGETQPVVSTLNSPDGSIDSNAAIVPTLNGSISAYASAGTQLILDVNGYFAP
jgi:virginiamycin B lyase